MLRNGLGLVLIVVATSLVTQTGCVSPAGAVEEAATDDQPSPADERVAALETDVATLEAEVAALQTEAGVARRALDEAEAAAAAAEEMAGAARARTALAQEAAVAAVGDAQAAASAAIADVQAAADAAVWEAQVAKEAADAVAGAAQEQAAKAQAAASAAQAKVDAMLQARPAAALMVAADQLDLSRLNLDSARVSLAGPDSVYVSSILYDGDNYSALVRYQGGSTATVAQVFGPIGVMIPPSVGLTQTELAYVAPDLLDISYVEVDGQGYSGQLRFAGDNRLQVTGIQRVPLLPAVEERISAADAAAAAAIAEAAAEVADARAAAAAARRTAQADAAEAAQARAEVDVLLQDMRGRRVAVPAAVELDLVSLDAARLSVAGPDSIYLSGIDYGDRKFTAKLRYLGDDEGILEALYEARAGRLPNVDLSTPALKVVAPDKLVISNVGIGGAAYTFSLRVSRDGTIAITTSDQRHRVRTAAELKRDDLLSAAGDTHIVSGFGAGRALPDEGSWAAGGATVRQLDAAATHAKFAVANVAQSGSLVLYGVAARVDGGARVGYGLHFLASATPQSGNTWNYGHSYLVWVTREPGFYDTDETQVQLYESLDRNRLVWRKSRNVARLLASDLILEALYDRNDCPATMSDDPCHGSITVLVDGAEQFKVAASAAIAGQTADTVALRTLGGPVEFTDLYVHAR